MGSSPDNVVEATRGSRFTLNVNSKSTTLSQTTLLDQIKDTPWVDSLTFSDENEKKAALSAIALWVDQVVIPEARKEVVAESESLTQSEIERQRETEEELRETVRSLESFKRGVTGYNIPDDCRRVFNKSVDLLVEDAKEARRAEAEVLAIDEASTKVKGNTFKEVDGKLVFSLESEKTEEMRKMSRIKEDITQTRKKRNDVLISTITGQSPKDKVDKGTEIKFPKDFLTMDPETFVSVFKSWLFQRSRTYLYIIPYLIHTMTSYDPKEGIFQPPPETKDIPSELREGFIQAGEDLCTVFQTECPKGVWDRITKSYPYGID